MGFERLHILRAGFGGDGDPVAHIGEGETHLHLAVGIGAGGIEEGHAALIGAAEQLHGGIHVVTLDGKRAERILRRGDAGGAEGYGFHRKSSGISILIPIVYHRLVIKSSFFT